MDDKSAAHLIGGHTSIRKSLSGKLLLSIIPLVAVALIAIVVFVSIQMKDTIEPMAMEQLTQESQTNALTISNRISKLESGFDGSITAIETLNATDVNTIKSALKPTMKVDPDCQNGIYIGMQDGTWVDPSDWVPPSDYVITQKSWYTEGLGHKTFAPGEPYIDEQTKGLVVSFTRPLKLSDGRTGVASADLALNGILQYVSDMHPMKTGGTMMLSNDYILSYFHPEYVGSKVGDHPSDTFLAAVLEAINSGNTQTHAIKSFNGVTYIVAFSPVPGTNWTLISSVDRDTVLAPLRHLQYVSITILVIAIIIISLAIWKLVSSFVTKPVTELTYNITRIASGDFTVDIPSGGEDEISVMNAAMGSYVKEMRHTLTDIKNLTKKLDEEAAASRTASSSLNHQAAQQSDSMAQIHTTMEGMASAVTELANNATELAGEVASLSQQGSETESTVSDLVAKARNGRKDMENLETKMHALAEAVPGMNKVVANVSESTEKITNITALISSIAEQTNLLSLNASIEAARAGEAGKGFAVVAGEIGNLAANSAESVTKISEIIDGITKQMAELSERSSATVNDINSGVESVSTAGKAFGTMFTSLEMTGKTVNDMIEKISSVNSIATSVAAISEEQSASTDEVSNTIDDLTKSAGQVADESASVDDSAATVSESARTIEEYLNKFKL